jgi:hypothetical protein
MRILVLAVITAIGIGFWGMSQLLAAPVNGTAINKAAATTSPVTKVPCASRRVASAVATAAPAVGFAGRNADRPSGSRAVSRFASSRA